MTAIPLYQLDAFTDRPFGGNPAAVCPLDEWLPDDVMQSIALENNLSETAFYVPEGDGYRLRWFTPKIEVDLCGHATLATGALILEKLEPGREAVSFETRSGTLGVKREGDMLVMDFPALPASEVPMPDGLEAALGKTPLKFLRAVKNMAVFESESDVHGIDPDFDFIAAMEGMGLIITAPGDGSDCASRYFAPHAGIDEDPVTGSAHCTIVPYWAGILGKDDIHARQISERVGDLYCRMNGDRVVIGGKARLVVEGTFLL
ncbi:MAG: PhzF family phenazine biosynthesis protein [Rhodospirillales bacterium]|nr:PhzF family phenazine biosynthesis protein [Rhodospirillales bacterium]MBO6787499.1 PhzF family phenazine biosynthesis protein [Rhodospirillales bacterium]